MTAFVAWYVFITLLGWITFPLTYRLFPALRDRGYIFSRALGLLIWGYVFWLFASLGIAQNDMGGLLLGLVVLGSLSAWAFLTTDGRMQTAGNTPALASRPGASLVNGLSSMVEWVKANKWLVITTEILFLLAFGLMAFVRSANPEIVGTEKPMELMMINGILNSPDFPPRDLWLSGYSISYYYFGYVMTSMIAMFTGVPATMAFNLMIALIFALSAIGAYGILYNLLANYQSSTPAPGASAGVDNRQSTIDNRQSTIVGPLLAPLFLLLLSNAEGFLEVLHARGLFWKAGPNFWTWLDILELKDPPSQTLSWIPQRSGWWWWRASRVIMDYDLKGNWTLDVINEFPAFSYLLGDLHPHVLSMPFVLLAVAVALNLFLGGWRGKIDLYFGQLHVSKTGFFLIALTLGGLAFLNTWDILIAGSLIVFSYALFRVRESGWGWERIVDILLLGIPALVTAYLMYLPFFIGFDSQAGGLIPNFMFPTRGAQLWVMWGTLFIPLFAYLIYLRREPQPADWRAGIFTALGIVALLLVAMFGIGFIALRFKSDLINQILLTQERDVGTFIADSMARRLSFIGGLITMLMLLIPVLSFLFKRDATQTEAALLEESDADFIEKEDDEARAASSATSTIFVLLLMALGTLLIIGPDFLYLSDNFGFRINTVFKFYYQAWIVLSLAAAYGAVVLLTSLRPGAAKAIFSAIFVLTLLVGLTYPVLGVVSKTNGFKPYSGFTLDDFDRVQRETPDEAAAITWLRSAPDGVIVEATRDAYSAYGRISIYTGLPTVLGWDNHEGQWRDYSLQGSRKQDIETLYSTPDWVTAQDIIKRYNIRYVYVGGLERSTYRVSEEKFNIFLRPVFQQGNVAIYQVP